MCKMGMMILLTSQDMLVVVNTHDPMGHEMTNKRHICKRTLSRRTETMVREAEVHELLQTKQDNDQG